MVGNVEKNPCERKGSGLDDLVIYEPLAGEGRSPNRNTAILLVSNSPSPSVASKELTDAGYTVVIAPSLTSAYHYLNKAYVDIVVVDLSGRPQMDADNYRSGTSEVYRFVEGVRSIDDTLGIFLIDKESQRWSFNLPVQELAQLNVESSMGEYGLRPFNFSEIADPKNAFHLKLRERLKARVESTEVLLSEIARSLPELPVGGELPFNLGEAAAKFYKRNPFGGAGLSIDRDSISVGGAVAPISRTRQYPEKTTTIHIKSISPKEAVDFAATYAFLIKKNPGLKTPRPFGYHIKDDRTAFQVLTFIIASTYMDIAHVLSPDSPNYGGNDETAKSDRALWNAMLDLLFKEKLPEWYRMTHDVVMSDDHDYPNARANIPQHQMAQMLLLPSRLADITGQGFTPEEISELRYTIDLLFTAGRGGGKVKRPNDSLLVLPVDPKGANIAFENFISMPDAATIRTRYLDEQHTPDVKRMSKEFASWGHGMLGEVNPVLVGHFQALNDPALLIPEKIKPALLFDSLESMLPGEDSRNFFEDIFVQGIYKAFLKAYVIASHAQVNEFRRAIAKNRDPDSYASTQTQLQNDFRHFIEQMLKHISLAYHGLRENWSGLPLERGVEKMTEHFTYKDEWFSLENGASMPAQRSPAYLRRMHQILSRLRDAEFSKFDFERMKRNSLRGDFLRY